MKYLKRFNESESTDYDFYMSIYDPLDKFVVGAYMIIEESEKTITVLNLQEREDTRSFFADGRVPYTFIPYKVTLLKSQIQILEPVDNVEGFNWIKIPYWLVKNNPGLKIMRVNKIKRVSNNSIFTKSLKPEMIDDNVRKYISSSDKDHRSIINLDLIIKRSMTP
jgi:hypothetical protein